jgi:hypothetical protein
MVGSICECKEMVGREVEELRNEVRSLNKENLRKYHLSYCMFCQNQYFDKHKGVSCSLTNDIAHFDVHCKDYIEDQARLKKYREKLNMEIRSDYEIHQDSISLSQLFYGKAVYKSFDSDKKLVSFLKGSIIYKGKRQYLQLIFVVLGLQLLILVLSVSNQIFNIVHLVLIFSMLLFQTLIYFKMKKSKPILLKIKNTYFKYKNEPYFFNNILDIGLSRTKERYPVDKIVLHTKTNGLVLLNINDVDEDSEDIVKQLKINLMDFKQKNKLIN